jgi:ketosteroid isomerase-like protein
VLVSQAPKAVKSGQQEIEQNYQNAFNTIPHHDSATVDQLLPLGTDALMSVGEYHLIGQGQSGPTKIDGYWTAVYMREGSTWKIRLLTAVPSSPPAPPAK